MILDHALQTAQLSLASLSAEHARDPYLAWMNDPVVTQYTESHGRRFNASDLAAFIGACNADPDVLLLGLFGRADGKHVGNIKLGPIEVRHRRGDIGLIVGDKSKWSRGYAREAIAAVTDYAFSALDLIKMTAGCYASNVGSQRAFIAAGWEEEGRRRRHGVIGGRRDDLILLARFRDGG